MFPPVASTTEPPVGPAASGRGWEELDSSPWFARGADMFEKAPDDCPYREGEQAEVEAWLNKIVEKWETRASASKGDVLILVGRADRIRLGDALRRQYDTNMGLARNRAESINGKLIDKTAKQPEEHKLTSKRIVVLVTGPQYSPTAEKPAAGQKEKCEVFADDRRVQVWLPSGS